MRGNGRVISGALVSAGVCTALTLAGVSAAGPATAGPTARATGTVTPTGTPTGTRTGASGTVPVIIFLKNQWAEPGNGLGSGDRLALIQAAQGPYLRQLQSLGATDVLS